MGLGIERCLRQCSYAYDILIGRAVERLRGPVFCANETLTLCWGSSSFGVESRCQYF